MLTEQGEFGFFADGVYLAWDRLNRLLAVCVFAVGVCICWWSSYLLVEFVFAGGVRISSAVRRG